MLRHYDDESQRCSSIKPAEIGPAINNMLLFDLEEIRCATQPRKILFFSLDNFIVRLCADTIKRPKIVGQRRENKTENSHKNYHYRKNSLPIMAMT